VSKAARKPGPQPAPSMSPLRSRRRYQNPPPTLEQVWGAIYDAASSLGDDDPFRIGPPAAEAERVEAVYILLRFARAELAKVEGPNRLDAILNLGWSPCKAGTVGEAIWQDVWEFLTIAGLRILTATNPAAGLQRLLGKKPGRPRVDNSVRDYRITWDVQERVDSGASIEDACKTIAAVAGLSQEAVIKIYYTRRAQVLQAIDLGSQLAERLEAGDKTFPSPVDVAAVSVFPAIFEADADETDPK